jgi:hypothetical protein
VRCGPGAWAGRARWARGGPGAWRAGRAAGWALGRATAAGWVKRELVSCCSGVLQQRGACGMAGNAAEGSEWNTCIDREEGREGSKRMGVKEQSSGRASEPGSSLLAGSVRNATEGSE